MEKEHGRANKPFKAKSTLFFERYARAENENVQMRVAVVLLAGLLVIVILGLVYTAARPRAVYYIPGAVARGVAYPDTIPPSSVCSFALSWLMGWMNFSPETVQGVYERSARFMAPALLSKTHAQAAQEIEKVHRDRLSSVFMLTSEPRLQEEKGGYKVVIEGKRGIYMGKEEMSYEYVRYEVLLLSMPATEDNPFALAVADIRKEEVRDEI